ncbi:MAG TPA: hypothetical protein VF721_07640 [Pyrinomonadaceae bacterium]|jgi:hypothetical protein
MQTEQIGNELIVRETPGCLWIFGLFFAFIGGVFVYGSLGGFVNYAKHEFWMPALSLLVGLIGVAAGIWIIYGAPMTKVVINRLENTVLLKRFGLFGRRESFYAFDEIERFCLVEEKDSEGDNIWFLGMKLADENETIKVSSLASHDERFVNGFVFQINEFTRKQISSSGMILEGEDESGAEIS